MIWTDYGDGLKSREFGDRCEKIISAIRWGIFHGKFPQFCVSVESAALFMTPEHLAITAAGMMKDKWGDYVLLVNEDYLQDKPKDELINTIFHELIHAYCMKNGIKDMEHGDDGLNFHTYDFCKTAARFGGVCHYVNDSIGWNDTELTDEAMARVETMLSVT